MNPISDAGGRIGLDADRRDDAETTRSLTRALDARKVAIFGASATPGKMGHEVVRQLLADGFRGDLTLINPKGGSVLDHPVATDPSSAEGADVAVIATSRENVAGIIEQCGIAGVPLAIVCAGGYRESGDLSAEHQLVAAARNADVAILGPNCIGILASDAALNLTTMPSLPAGNISCVIQSGGVSFQIAHRLSQLGAGFDALINLGNKADIDFTVALEAIALRPSTSAILLYMEGFDEGDRFLTSLSQTTIRVPVVIAAGGDTDAGLRSASSHTGAMLTPWDRLAGVFEGCGAFVARTLAEAIAAAVAGRRTDGPHLSAETPSVFVVSDGGGLATLTADALSRAGFALPQPSELLRSDLASIPGIGHAIPANPFDFAGMADRNPHLYPQSLELAIDSGEFDGVLLAGAFGSYRALYGDVVGDQEELAADTIARLARRSRIPVIAQSTVATDGPQPIRSLRGGGVPCFEWPEEAAAGFALRLKPCPTDDLSADHQQGPPEGTWDPDLATDTARIASIFDDHGIPHELGELVSREDVGTRSGERWVLKVDGFPHKTRAGALKIVGDREKLIAFQELTLLAEGLGVPAAIRLAPYLEHTHEVLITFWRSEATGQGWAVGTGGVLTERTADVRTGRFPVSREDVVEVLGRTRIGATILAHDPAIVDPLVVLVLRLAGIFEDQLGDLSELECNPVALAGSGATVLDVLPSRTAPPLGPSRTDLPSL